MDIIVEKKGVDEILFAKKLSYWIRRGFPELGDLGGLGLGMTVGAVCAHNLFLTEPHVASKEVWEEFNKNAAPNGAVMRTSILGCYEYDRIENVIRNTERIAKVTHWDPRCVASCVTTTVAIALMLQGQACNTQAEYETIIQEAQKHGRAFVEGPQLEEFERYLTFNLQQLQLDEPKSIGYTYKCFGCGLYGLRSSLSFKDTLMNVIKEAGDADTNGAVCGAVLGCKIGYSKLPIDWLKALPHKKWLDQKIVSFLNLMGLRKPKEPAGL